MDTQVIRSNSTMDPIRIAANVQCFGAAVAILIAAPSGSTYTKSTGALMLALMIPAALSIAAGVGLALTRSRVLAWVCAALSLTWIIAPVVAVRMANASMVGGALFLITASITGVFFALLADYLLWTGRSAFTARA